MADQLGGHDPHRTGWRLMAGIDALKEAGGFAGRRLAPTGNAERLMECLRFLARPNFLKDDP